MDIAIAALLGLAFAAMIVYSVALQRRAVRSQTKGIDAVSESLQLQRRSIELSEQILAELKKLNRSS